MRIVACLSWWEESPAWLARCVAGVGRFADHLVAVDGAYGHMADSTRYPRSGGYQVDAIVAAAQGAGIGLTLHQPLGPWLGDEIAKRSFLFKAATLVADPGEDWLYVVDADEMMIDVPSTLRDQLEAASADGFEVAAVEWFERTIDQPIPGDDQYADRFWEHLTVRSVQAPMPKFFRADPTLRVERAHYIYVAGPADEPRYLWGNSTTQVLEPHVAITGMRFEHWSRLRQPARRRLQKSYYEVRDRLDLETLRPVELDGIPMVERV